VALWAFEINGAVNKKPINTSEINFFIFFLFTAPLI
jgi:hypothetical protein